MVKKSLTQYCNEGFHIYMSDGLCRDCKTPRFTLSENKPGNGKSAVGQQVNKWNEDFDVYEPQPPISERYVPINDRYPNGDPKAVQGNKKLTMTNIPLTMIPLISKPMNDGAIKYGKYNWLSQPRESMDNMVYINGALRHLFLYLAGQDLTSDSQVHHIDAVMAGLSVMRDAIIFGRMKDNRVKLSNEDLKIYEEIINNTYEEFPEQK